MGGCVISRIRDPESIKAVVKLPSLWATVAEDGSGYDSWEPDLNECWLKAEDENGLIGLFNYHQFTGFCAQVHPMILTDRRGSESIKAGIESLRWVFENTDCMKVLALVPVIYRNVKLYAMKCGLTNEAKISSIYTKNGKIHDMWVLGITRSEFEAKHYEQGQ